MSSKEDNELDPPRLRLMNEKLGKLLKWQTPKIVETIGPFNPEIFQVYEANLREVVKDCRGMIKSFSDNQVGEIAAGSSKDNGSPWREWQMFRREEIRRLIDTEPPWYAGGFGHLEHLADFEHWCKMPDFSVQETLCLSIGITPHDFSASRLEELKEKADKKLRPPLVFLVDRYDLLMRKFDPHHYHWRVAPRDFLNWSRQVDFQSHPKFMQLLERYHVRDGEKRAKSAPAEMADRREVNSIAKLFTAVVVSWLGYDPTQKRGPIPSEIVDLAAESGITVTEDTVRKYLRLGASFMRDQQEED